MVFLYLYLQDEYYNKAVDFMNYLLGLSTTDKGLVWISSSQWGSLRYAGNFAMYAMQAGHLGIMSEDAFNFAEQQINYALGDAGQSYVCGFGTNPPERPHHRPASCPGPGESCGWDYYYTSDANQHVLNGALVGGPNENDEWTDDRTDYAVSFVLIH